jgi:hypothetical protein
LIKNLFFTAALLSPGFVYGATPSANLSVQVVPPGKAGTCGTITGQAATDLASIGFNTCALYNDFTTAIPNTVGTGLSGGPGPFTTTPAGNWLNCNGDTAAAVWYWVGSRGAPGLPCSRVSQANDNGTLGLRIQMFNTDPVNGSPPQNTEGLWTVGQTQPSGSSYPNAYFEITMRNNQTIFGMGDAFWSWEPSGGDGNILEIDFIEDFGSGGFVSGEDSGQVCWWSTCNGNYNITSLNGGFDRTQYFTIGGLLTGDGNGNWSYCTYLNGTRVGCKVNNPATYPTTDPAGMRRYLRLDNSIICDGSSNGLGCLQGGTWEHDLWVKSVKVLTCANWQGGQCTTSLVQ